MSSLRSTLMGHWKMNQSSGSDAPDAHRSHLLTDHNTVGSVSGKLGNAGDFESTSTQYFDAADHEDFTVGDEDWTIAAWVQLESKVSVGSIVSKRSVNLEYYLRYVGGGTDRLQLQISDDGAGSGVNTVNADNLGSPSTATWYFVVAWHDATANTINIQVNNGTVDSVSHTTGIFSGTSLFSIGARPSADLWDGLIDSVSLWRRVLTSDERTELYNSGSGLDYDDWSNGFSMTLDADGTIGGTVADSDTDAAYFDDGADNPDGLSSDWFSNDTSESNAEAWFSLSNVATDFDSIDELEIVIDGQAVNAGGDDTCTLTCRIFDADNDTTNALCDESGNLLTDADSTRLQRTVSLSNLTGTKTQWDAAYIRFTWTYSKVTGPDNLQLRVFGTKLNAVYTPSTGPLTASVSESLGLSDTVSRIAHGNRDLSESLGLSDTVSRIAHGNRAPSESLALSDAVARDVDYLRQVTESLGLTDSVTITTTGGGILTLTPSESLGLTDTLARIAHGSRAPSESLGLSDAVSRDVDTLRSLSESFGLSDTLARIAHGNRAPSESLGLSDALARIAHGDRNPSESLGLTDAVSREVDYFRQVTDSLGLTDAVSLTVSGGTVLTLTPSDSLGLSDALARLVLSDRSLSESLGLSDAAVRDADVSRVPSESLGLADSVTRQVPAALRQPSESLGLSDTVGRACTILRALEETLAFTDTFGLSQVSPIVGTGSRPGWYYLEPGRTWVFEEPGRTWRFIE